MSSHSGHQPDWLLLDRWLAGECSPAEVEQVQRWLDGDPEAAAALGAFREAINRRVPPELAPPVWDVERAWARLDETTGGKAGAQYRLPPPLRRADVDEAGATKVVSSGAASVPARAVDVAGGRPPASRWLRAAAVLLLLGGSAAVAVWRGADDAWRRAVAAAPPRVIMTQRSERVDLRLADGTRVVLAPESRLTIPVDFGRARRELTLVGEGYFEVVHDTARPFLVHAAHGIVYDLGTRFSVRRYPGDSTVRVVVAEGTVAAGLAGAPLRGPILRQGDLARLDTAGALTVVRGVDVDRYESWVDGRLRFDATPLREVLPELARWYDLDIELADTAVGARRVTITLRDEPLAQVLSAIGHITNTRYEQTGRAVRFSALPTTLPASRAP